MSTGLATRAPIDVEAVQKVLLEENQLHRSIENERFSETQSGRDSVPTLRAEPQGEAYILDSLSDLGRVLDSRPPERYSRAGFPPKIMADRSRE